MSLKRLFNMSFRTKYYICLAGAGVNGLLAVPSLWISIDIAAPFLFSMVCLLTGAVLQRYMEKNTKE